MQRTITQFARDPAVEDKFNIVPVRGADSEGVGRLSVGANLDRMLGCGRAGHREP